MEFIDTIAKAIHEVGASLVWEQLSDLGKDLARKRATAALAAMRQPSPRMEEAGDYEIYERAGNGEEVWREMIEAALAEVGQ